MDHMTARAVSPGLPEDTTTHVDWTEAASPFLTAAGVRPLPAPVGFGAATTGGAGGEVVHVHKVADNPDDPAPHTLRWAVNRPGPKWIVFDDKLTVELRAPLPLMPDTTLDGRGHKVTISGGPGIGGLLVHDVENVVVHGLTLAGFGDTSLTESNDPHDAISVCRSRRVWVDHNDVSGASDKAVGVSITSEVTVTGNHFHDQKQTLQIGNMTNANEDVDTTVTVAWNHFDRCGYRCPVLSYGKAHVFNNVMHGWDQWATRSQRIGQTYLEGNIYLAEDDPNATLVVCTGDGGNDSGSLYDDRDGYLYDTGNLFLGKCKRQDTGPGHMFNPAEAYDYMALPASERLASAIVALAGP